VKDCGNGILDPNAPLVYSAVTSSSYNHFSNNFYFNKAGSKTRYVDRRVGSLGNGFDGNLAGWKNFTNSDTDSVEVNPQVNNLTYHLCANSPAKFAVPILNGIIFDFYGKKIPSRNGLRDGGVLFSNFTPVPSVHSTAKPTIPSISPTYLPSLFISAKPTVMISKKPTAFPTFILSKIPTSRPTVSPTSKPSYFGQVSLTLQSGNSAVNGLLFNSSFETGISTQYSASYNNYNGMKILIA
jgi:hypothetical protein